MIGNNFPGHAGGRRPRRAVRRGQVPLARHDRAGGRDHGGLAHRRRQDASRTLRKKEIVAGASGTRRHHLHLSVDDERVPRHQVQDRHRLCGRQRDQPRDGARRGARRATTPGRAGRRPRRPGSRRRRSTSSCRPGRGRPTSTRRRSRTLARTPDERKLIELVVSGTQLGRPMATTPDVPADRVAALRAAYRGDDGRSGIPRRGRQA